MNNTKSLRSKFAQSAKQICSTGPRHNCTFFIDMKPTVVTRWQLNEVVARRCVVSNSPRQPQPHECVDSPGLLARSPGGKSGLKLLHSSWRSAGRVPIYGHPPLLLAPRVRPKSPHANVKIGPGPRKRPAVSKRLKISFFIHNV